MEGSADGATQLLPLGRRLNATDAAAADEAGKRVRSIERLVAREPEGAAVQGVGAGLSHNIDRPAAGRADLG